MCRPPPSQKIYISYFFQPTVDNKRQHSFKLRREGCLLMYFKWPWSQWHCMQTTDGTLENVNRNKLNIVLFYKNEFFGRRALLLAQILYILNGDKLFHILAVHFRNHTCAKTAAQTFECAVWKMNWDIAHIPGCIIMLSHTKINK